ncbi:MAG: DUF308 domain-containing protein [Chloroflexota bacterium]|nr:DUF308 domain-containing protein [Chloroflexota bacterium]
MLATLARSWWTLVLRGALAVLFGIVAWLFPDLTVGALVLLFGAYALVDGAFALVAAFSGGGGRRGALLLEGILGIAAGVLTIIWPDLTATALLFFIAAWAIITGVFEIVAAIELRCQIEGELLLALAGVASILFGVLAFIFPTGGALAVVWMIGSYAILFGVVLIALGFRLRGAADAR